MDLPPAGSGDTWDERGSALAAAFVRAVGTDPAGVAEVTASLHRPVRDVDGLIDLLNRAAAAAVRWLPDVDFAGITVALDHTPLTLAATDPVVPLVDDAQSDLGDGPCLTAMRTGAVVSATAAEAEARWPQLTTRARGHGVASFLASPLVLPGVGRGSINLYSRNTEGFSGAQADLLVIVSAYVSRALDDFAVLRSAQVQVQQMREAMTHRAPVEQAKGILMAVHQSTADAAFAQLRTQSQNSNTRLRDVAATFVAVHARQPLGAVGEGGGPGVPEVSSGAWDFQSAFDHAPVGMAITDPFGTLLTVNPALASLLGRSAPALAGATLFDVTHPEDRDAARAACADLRDGPELTAVLEVRLCDGDGTWVAATVSTAKVLAGDGSAAHLVMSVEDLTTHDALTAQLRRQAMHDPLTGLANRTLLQQLQQSTNTEVETSPAAPWSVLFVDIDGFKAVNDLHGHAVGDIVLTALADRLRAQLRPQDTAARLGGDEFAVLCAGTDETAAATLVATLSAALAAPVDVDGTPVTVTVSIGAATSTPGEPVDTHALLRDADTAMYETKRRTQPRH